jgi:hypothetical protein
LPGDAEDDPDGNFQHIVEAAEVTAEEVEDVLCGHEGDFPDAYPDATGNPIIFGTTSTGKRIALVYIDESDADVVLIRRVTAYPVREFGG